MNAKHIRWILLPTLHAAALGSHAGSPRGLRLLVIPTDAARAHLAPIDAVFQSQAPAMNARKTVEQAIGHALVQLPVLEAP